MSELERALLELGGRIEYPATPNLAATVGARLVAPPRRRFAWRPALAVALAVLAIAVGAVLAVPQARTAILEWLGLEGVDIEFVPTVPEVGTGVGLDVGEIVPLDEARRRVPYRVLLPELDEEPERVYYRAYPPGGQIGLFLDGPNDRRLLFTEFRASHVREFIQKLVGPGTRVERVRVDGAPGVWLAGDPHAFIYQDEAGQVTEEQLRLAGNVLLWERAGLTLRLEGRLTKKQALEIARSVR